MNSEDAVPPFTPRAQQAIKFATEEMATAGDQLMSTDHLLIGLTRLGSGVAATMLQRLDIEPATLRNELKAPHPSCDAEDLKHILTSASNFALRRNATHLGTEHIFFAIVSDESCAGAMLLRRLGVENTTLRDEIAREIH